MKNKKYTVKELVDLILKVQPADKCYPWAVGTLEVFLNTALTNPKLAQKMIDLTIERLQGELELAASRD